MDKYLTTMSELLEVESFEMNDDLTSFEYWDSLTNLAVLAFCSSEYGITLSAEEVENAKTIGGLKKLIESKI